MAKRTPTSESTPSSDLSVGDWIECEFQLPTVHTRGAQMLTPKSLAYGRKLISDPKSGWRKATRDWSAGARSQMPGPPDTRDQALS